MNAFSRNFGARFSGRTARIITARQGEALTEGQLRQYVPSLFAVEPHDSRSERYEYISTFDVLRKLVEEGFQPTFAVQAQPRVIDKRNFTKHMIRLRREGGRQVDGVVPEVVLTNSHDGTSSYVLTAGAWRHWCLNGMVCGEAFTQVRIPHRIGVIDQVVEGTFEVVNTFDRVLDGVEDMRQITLDRDETELLGQTALEIRFADRVEKGLPAPISVAQINAPRRSRDQSSDLWTAFNRIQENAIKGGVTANVQNPETGRWGRRTTREVQGVDGLVGVNRALWTMAERFAELKRAA